MVKAAASTRTTARAIDNGGSSQAHEAYEKTRRDIIRCALRPGQAITEGQLAERYELGKTPVREALARLAHENLVQPLPRRGYRITPVTLKDVRDILGLRLILEVGAARLAAGRCDIPVLRRLDALASVGYDPADARSIEKFLRASSELHNSIAAATGNEKLELSLARLLDESERLVRIGLELSGKPTEASRGHRKLVDALAKGDRESAAELMADHVRAVERLIVDAVVNSEQLGAFNLVAT